MKYWQSQITCHYNRQNLRNNQEEARVFHQQSESFCYSRWNEIPKGRLGYYSFLLWGSLLQFLIGWKIQSFFKISRNRTKWFVMVKKKKKKKKKGTQHQPGVAITHAHNHFTWSISSYGQLFFPFYFFIFTMGCVGKALPPSLHNFTIYK